jgi:hypothetical protein
MCVWVYGGGVCVCVCVYGWGRMKQHESCDVFLA